MMKVDLIRDPSYSFPSLENKGDVTSMRVWHCKYKSLRGLGEFVGLRELVVATFPDDSLDFLSALRELQYLRIIHLPKIVDISPLSALGSLEYLSLSTLPSWDSAKKRTVVNSLLPVSGLPRLKGIELLGVVASDGGLETLASNKCLESGRFSGYHHEVVTEFYSVTGIKDDFIPKSSFD